MSAEITREAVGLGRASVDYGLVHPAWARFARRFRLSPFMLAIMFTGLTSGSAQVPSVGLDARQALPACEVNLAQQVAVKGLNPAWESSHPLSSAVIPSMGLATVDMASALDATVGNYMNLNGLPGGAVAITGMGILKLVHDGQLSLADRPFPFSGTGTVIAVEHIISLFRRLPAQQWMKCFTTPAVGIVI
jgi:hypothetical protein